jgi:OmpA-OmpF porin, OOP family
VTDPNGSRIAGASLELLSGPETGRWSLPSGDVTRSLPPGTYALRVRAPHFSAAEESLTVPAEAARHEQVVQLSPAVAGGTVILSVQNEAGQPVSALVTILGEGRKFTTGGDGVGTEPVPVGEVELSVWAEGYRPKRVKVQVGRDEKKSVDVVLELTRVVVLADRVDIRDKVFFDLDSATIKAASYNILDDVAATLENHPELRLVEVQGHTDDQGAEDYNLELSGRRAQAVRTYLMGQGIEGDRLVARGYGESQPLEPGTTPEAREVNRRVVFKIVAGPEGMDGKRPRPGGRR